MPLSSDDEILVKAPDGSWKIFRGGKLVDRAAATAPPPAELPVVGKSSVVSGQSPLSRTPTVPIMSRSKPASVAPPPPPAMSPPSIRGASQRSRVMDVIPPKELVGPVQELRMSLADFRALAPTARERTTCIASKLALLEQEGYAKKLEGLAMWRGSEVYDCYVRLGQESMAKGEAVVATIERKTAAGEPTLTLEEFKAMTELSRALRF